MDLTVPPGESRRIPIHTETGGKDCSGSCFSSGRFRGVHWKLPGRRGIKKGRKKVLV
jgi:hypothetical protein